MHVAAQSQRLPRIQRQERSSVAWGQLLLFVYVIVAVARIQEVIPALVPLRLGAVAGGLALLLWLKAPGTLAEKIPIGMPAVRDVMLLLGLAIFIVPIGVWPGNSIRFLFAVYLKTVLLFLLVLYWCKTIQDVRRLIWVCCLSTAGLAAPGLWRDPEEGRYMTSEALSYDANDLALLFAVVLPWVLFLISTSRRLLKWILLGVALLCLYGIVLTQSRGGLLALMVIGGLILYKSQLTKSAKYGIVALAVIVFGILAGTAWKERIKTMWEPQTEYDRTAGGRTDIWKTGLVLFVTRPWGVGIDGFTTAEGLSHGGFGKWNAAHNTFLQLGVELGVVGLFIFLRLLTGTMRTLRTIKLATETPRGPTLLQPRIRGPRSNLQPTSEQQSRAELFHLAEALEISLWGFIVGGFFLSQAYSGLLYILLALAIVCIRLAQQEATGGGNALRSPRLGRPTLALPPNYRVGG